MIMGSPWVEVHAFTSQQEVKLVTHGCTGKPLFLEIGSAMTLMSAMLAVIVMLLPISLRCQDTMPTNNQNLDQVSKFSNIFYLAHCQTCLQYQIFLIDRDYYCDANFVNNNFCPEYDIYEGNKYTMMSTLHTCDYVAPSYYPSCDRGGCGSNAYYVNPNLMCPDDRCTINTNRRYTISHTQSKVFKSFQH